MNRMLVCAAAFAAQLSAQTFGEITGSVSDSTGAAIANAAVTITNLSTNQVRQANTSGSGDYTVPFLVPGRYKLEARSAGFKASIVPERTLQVGDVLRVDFTLEVGDVTESRFTVMAPATPVAPMTGGLGADLCTGAFRP